MLKKGAIMFRTPRTLLHTSLVLTLLVLSIGLVRESTVLAQGGTDFPGTVLMVDPATGKLAVKKDVGGTRFAFVVNDKTQFEGPALKSLTDVKKGDRVTVNYQVSGSQYLAVKVTKK